VRHSVRVAFMIGVFASALPAAEPAAGPAPAVLVVGQEPGARYASVQAAVDAAPEGATIRIGPGTYDGAVRIAKPLTLQGAGWDKTTIVAPQPPVEQVMQAQREAEQQVRQAMQAKDEGKARAIVADLRKRLLSPAVHVDSVRGVVVRDLKIAAQPVSFPDGAARSPGVLVLLTNAQAFINGCVVAGSPGDGIHITDGSDGEVHNSLVAGLWGDGIVVGGREGRPSRATVANSDVRNCYHYGIAIGPGHGATVERCRISGAAWHGIRYDDASPTISGNRISGNARCGIYASGATAAVVRDNLFLKNEMGGMSCLSANGDTVTGNTFAENLREGMMVIGASRPAVERNIFYGSPTAVACAATGGNGEAANAVGAPRLRDNLFWKNRTVLAVQDARPALNEQERGTSRDPEFGAGQSFALSPQSQARRQRVGAADPMPAGSPFPLQPEEMAIIPDGPGRDWRAWKRAGADPARAAAPAAVAPPAQAPVASPQQKAAYVEAFTDLYNVLGREYPCFELKNIDWKAVGEELLPRAQAVDDDAAFGLLCMELVARLEDSHAFVGPGKARPPTPKFPAWDPGFACLIDDRGKPVVYHVDPNGPAANANVRPGTTVVSIDGKPAEEAIAARMTELSRYSGYSSDRYLRYHAAQFLGRAMDQGAKVRLEVEDPDGTKRGLELPATLNVRYLPRLPVPIPGVRDAANVSWTMLDDRVGYIYVRRIGNDLIDRLDAAVGELKDAKALIVDVRGNSGGGFDFERSHRNFNPDDPAEPDRPRFKGPMAMLIDARCISAGEGWASWFAKNKRARFFGEGTAGASSRKRQYVTKDGLYTVTIPVKAYNGYLDRPIERRGLEPDEPVRQNARDLADGRDTVLEAAKKHLAQ
jgi:parallel beta-helix repeat protein